MKKLVVVSVALLIVIALGCKKADPTPTSSEAEKTTATLKSAPWTVQSVTIDGVTSDTFKDMTLNFTPTAYTTTKGNVVWPAAGTWTFVNATAKAFKRDDGVDVDIVTLTENSLVLSLQWSKTTIGSGRENSVKGKHVFTFKR